MSELNMLNKLQNKVLNFALKTKLRQTEFATLALEIFRFQYKNNHSYASYLNYLNIAPEEIHRPDQIPFMPISFYKHHLIQSGKWKPEVIFKSSGTTGTKRSQHAIYNLDFYRKISKLGFENVFDDIKNYSILAFLPSYIENKESSLLFMVDKFIEDSESKHSGYFIEDYEHLLNTIEQVKKEEKKGFLFGVTFALMDLAESHSLDLSDFIIMETGGMKGRRKEILRDEVHSLLKNRFTSSTINSEYGMAELLSQAYSKGNGIFTPPSWMKVFIRELNDPFHQLENGKVGGINIIDLANVHSCSFIETQDLGKIVNKKGEFQVLGRYDNSDIRGCNLLHL